MSEQQRHTAGAWIATGEGGMRDGGSTKLWPCFVGKVASKNGQSIVSYSSFLGVQGGSPEEAAANARLIAAAPDLLAACEAAFDHATNDPLARLDQPQLNLLRDAVRLARA